MALYSYKKDYTKKKRINHPRKNANLLLEKLINTRPIKPVYHDEYKETVANIQNLKRFKLFNIIIPLSLIIWGATLLLSQASPYAQHFAKAYLTDSLDQDTISPLSTNFNTIRLKYITDPGASYFEDYMDQIAQSQPIPNDPESLAYKGTMYLNIPKINLTNAPISANVDSSSNESYLTALNEGLAHFKGSKIPGRPGNVFVYGHSASGDYAEKHPEDPVTAFTNLFKLKIGDEIIITKDNEDFHYAVTKIKEVSPEDTSVIEDTNTDTLTLMTCSPPGLSIRRLIVTANATN